MHRVSVKNTTIFVMYKNVPTTCLALSSWAFIRLDIIVRATILKYNIINSVSVSGGDEISFTKNMGVCGI
jgi:hypothetical protein